MENYLHLKIRGRKKSYKKNLSLKDLDFDLEFDNN